MATSRLKSWFTQVTATVSTIGSRFRTGDKPTQSTFEDLLASIPFKKEASDKAKEGSTTAELSTVVGLVQAASDAQVAARQTPLSDRTLVVQPHQIPLSNVYGKANEGAIDGPLDDLQGLVQAATDAQVIARVTKPTDRVLVVQPHQIPVETPSSASQVYVAAEGSDDTGSGTITNPYGTLEYAMTKNKDIYVLAGTHLVVNNLPSFTRTVFLESGVVLNAGIPYTVGVTTITDPVTQLFLANNNFKLSGDGVINLGAACKLLSAETGGISFKVEGVTVISAHSVITTLPAGTLSNFNNVIIKASVWNASSQFNSLDSNTIGAYLFITNSIFKGIKFKFDHSGGMLSISLFDNCSFYLASTGYILEMGRYYSSQQYHVNFKNCTFDHYNSVNSCILLNSNYTTDTTYIELSLLNCVFTRCLNSIVNVAVTKKWIAYTNLSSVDVTADGLTTDFRNTGGGIGNIAKQITDSNTFVDEKPKKLYTYSLFSN